MGINNTKQRRNSGNQQNASPTKTIKTIQSGSTNSSSTKSPGGCFGCMHVSASASQLLDNDQLNFGSHTQQPKGRLTHQSVAFLKVDEINFFQACGGRNISVIRYYLKQQVNVNILDQQRTSPLHVAARHGSLQVVEQLLNWSASTNITDMAGWTPLHVASFFSRGLICHILIRGGADINIRNRDGLSPSDLAKEQKTREIFDYHIKKRNKPVIPPVDELLMKDLILEEEKLHNDNSQDTEDPEIYTQYQREMNAIQGPSKSSFSGHAGGILENNGEALSFSPKKHRYYLYFQSLQFRLGGNISNFHLDQEFSSNQPANPVPPNFVSNSSYSSTNRPFSNNLIRNDSFSNSEQDNITIFQLNNRDTNNFSKILAQDSNNYDPSELSYSQPNDLKAAQLVHPPYCEESNIPNDEFDIGFSKRQNLENLQEVMQNNQSIPFQLKNVYNTPCDVQKELQFKTKNNNKLPPTHNNTVETRPQSNSFVGTATQAGYFGNHSRQNSQSSNYQGSMIGPLAANEFDSILNNKFGNSRNPSTSSLYFVNRAPISLTKLVSDQMLDQLHISQQANGDLSPLIPALQNKDTNMLIKREFGFQQSVKTVDIGICLFNYVPICGLSYLILFNYIEPTPEKVAAFLHMIDTPVPSKQTRVSTTRMLTELSLLQCQDIIYYFIDQFSFSTLPFCSALRVLFSHLEIENDPEKIDCILAPFAQRYFKKQTDKEQQLFQNSDAVHMLAFATAMLDVEFQTQGEGCDVQSLIRDFNSNVGGTNDGENFSKQLLSNIVESVMKQHMIILRSEEKDKEDKIKNWSAFVETLKKNSDISVRVMKTQQNNGNHSSRSIVLNLHIIQSLAYIIGEEEGKYIAIFSMYSLVVSYKNQIITLKPAKNHDQPYIYYAKLQNQQQFIIEEKSQISFKVLDPQDGKQLDATLRGSFKITK